MNELIEQKKPVVDEIIVILHFFNGETFQQDFPVANGADLVEGLLKWFRSPKEPPTITWNSSEERRILTFNKSHIRHIDIIGYIELTRLKQKWHEKLFDKFLTMLIFLKMKGGDKFGNKKGNAKNIQR